MMKGIKNELKYLPKERVFMEFKKALETNKPSIFFNVLKKAEVLDVYFMPIYKLIGALQPEKYHPEGDSYNHTMIALDKACNETTDLKIRFSVLVHDLGKGETPKEEYPHHYNHEKRGVKIVERFSSELGVPKSWEKCGKVACLEHMRGGIFNKMKPAKKVEFIERIDKTILGLHGLQIVVNCDKSRNDEVNKELYDFETIGKRCLEEVTAKKLIEKYNLKEGKSLGERLHQERVEWMKRKEELKMNRYYFTSESVTEGHPDKLCDTISDAILDSYLAQDKNARVAVETFASGNEITIAGQVTANGEVDVEKLVREKIKEIGYDNEKLDMDYRTCLIHINITKQSPDIAMGVDVGGAGDQGIMFGYACSDTEELMPFAISMAHKLSKRLTEVRKSKEIPYLRPDGKTQVTVEYEGDTPKRIETILISTQHNADVEQEDLKKDIIEKVIKKVIPENMLDENTKIYINPTGRFVIGGPLGDTGLTGRKIIVDTYGGYSRHGGGAFSGKDPSKVDRSAAYMLRHIAKNLVANGYCKKCEIQISYAIGMKEPLSIYINTFGTGTKSEEELVNLVKEKFDLTPAGIINYLDLKRPIYEKTTNYGHFGKEELPWEKIIKM